MKKILILGANGKIARLAEKEFLEQTDDQLILFLRNSSRLSVADSDREQVVEGDTTNVKQLEDVLDGVDVVYANLAGDNIKDQAVAVTTAMNEKNVKRLIWISTIGIYDEVPGEFGKWNNSVLNGYLQRYRAAADVIEGTDLDFTIIRPAWLTDKDEIDFEVTQKGEDFKGTEVSRKSIAHVVVEVAQNNTEVRHSIGVNKPGTDGDKPAWY